MTINDSIALYGFNNLTKNLSFSLYKLHYLQPNKQLITYNDYIKKNYNSAKLTLLLTDICHAVGGSLLNVASQDYQPHGASVTLMISEEAKPTVLPESLVAHLDKSHLCIHTYPDEVFGFPAQKQTVEANVSGQIAVFRADIELSTCGVISPLNVINYVLSQFNADVVDIDYRIRGMTRNLQGKMQFIDQHITHISDHLSKKFLLSYDVENTNLIMKNLFHTRLCRKANQLSDNILTDQYRDTHPLNNAEKQKINASLYCKMRQLFHNNELTDLV